MRQTDGTAPPLCCRHQFARAPMEFSSLDKVGAPAGGQARGPQKPPVCSAAAAESAACCPRRADGPAARPAEGGRGQRAPFTGQLHSHGPGAAAVWAARTRPAWERAIAPSQDLPCFPLVLAPQGPGREWEALQLYRPQHRVLGVLDRASGLLSCCLFRRQEASLAYGGSNRWSGGLGAVHQLSDAKASFQVPLRSLIPMLERSASLSPVVRRLRGYPGLPDSGRRDRLWA